MICKKCYTENADDARFCKGCGNNLEEQRAYEAAESSWICACCATPNGADTNFCWACGTSKVSSEAQNNASVSGEPAQWICSSCGNVNNADMKFCVGCGAKAVAAQTVANTYNAGAASAPAQWVCSNCRTVNGVNVKFCVGCGSPKVADSDNMGDTTYDVTTPPAKKKGNKTLIILIIVAVLIAAAAVALFVLDPFSSDDSDKKNGDKNQSGAYATVDINGADIDIDDIEVVTETEAAEQKVYENIADSVGVFDDYQMQSIDEKVTHKESIINTDIKICIVNNMPSDDYFKTYAQERSDEEFGTNGILIAIDADRDKALIVSTGTGADYVNKDVKTFVSKDVSKLLAQNDYRSACVTAVDAILEIKKVSKFEAVEGAEQVIYVVKNSGSNTGKLTLVEWVDGDEEILYEIDKVYLGKDGITSSPSETKSATPKGTFKLGFAFSDHYLDTKLDSVIISNGDVWVDDSNSKYYNTLQHGSTSNSMWSSAENTYYAFSSNIFEACILIEHNGDGYTKGVSGKGSCIYLSGKNKELSTSYGDVNISASQMETILSYLDEAKNPHIVIK